MIKQLAKTTPFLTGNQKLDIILERDKDNLEYLTDSYINISTTTSNIPYPKEVKESIYNYSYAENIRQFYELTKDYFYKDMGDFKSDYALYYDHKVDVYDHTYQSGLKRAEYGIYNKQWHFFCPIFINNSYDIDRLSFRIGVRGEATDPETDTHITTPQENMVREIKLSDILKNFLKTYLTNIDDNILNIFISKNYGNISGMDVTSGVNKVIDISYIFPDLLDREKTLMEFDNLITNTFEQNKLIIRQILNLDFYFSPQDIFAKTINDNLKWKRWNIYIDVLFDGQKVDFVDIYGNFNKIPKCIIEGGSYFFDESRNVFDYLHDNMNTENILLNKITQPLCHWSVLENPEYIYNLYNGFSPILRYYDLNDQPQEIDVSGYFFTQCNSISSEYSKNINNLTWCNFYYVDASNQTSENELLNIYRNDEIFMGINLENSYGGTYWLNNNKFNISGMSYFNPIQLAVVIIPNGVSAYFPNYTKYPNCKMYIYAQPTGDPDITPTRIMFVVQNDPEYIRKLTLHNLVNKEWTSIFYFNSNDPGDPDDPQPTTPYQNMEYILCDSSCIPLMETLGNLFRGYIAPNKVIFGKSIIPVLKQTGVRDSSEIFYVKNESANSELFRYEGRLRPTFIDTNGNNDVYYNEDWRYKIFIGELETNSSLTTYAKFANKFKSKPLYPSIGYFPYDSSRAVYHTFPEYYEDYKGDIQWQKAGLVWFLPEKLEYEFTENRNVIIDDGYLMDYLSEQLPIDPYILNYYIYNLYKYQLDFEYEAIDNVEWIRYRVKFILR